MVCGDNELFTDRRAPINRLYSCADRAAEGRPSLHKLPALVDRGAPAVGALHLAALLMRKAKLRDLVGADGVDCPVSESRTEPVHSRLTRRGGRSGALHELTQLIGVILGVSRKHVSRRRLIPLTQVAIAGGFMLGGEPEQIRPRDRANPIAQHTTSRQA
jgi:hypothetical protein